MCLIYSERFILAYYFKRRNFILMCCLLDTIALYVNSNTFCHLSCMDKYSLELEEKIVLVCIFMMPYDVCLDLSLVLPL